jgi:hypothetical protein
VNVSAIWRIGPHDHDTETVSLQGSLAVSEESPRPPNRPHDARASRQRARGGHRAPRAVRPFSDRWSALLLRLGPPRLRPRVYAGGGVPREVCVRARRSARCPADLDHPPAWGNCHLLCAGTRLVQRLGRGKPLFSFDRNPARVSPGPEIVGLPSHDVQATFEDGGGSCIHLSLPPTASRGWVDARVVECWGDFPRIAESPFAQSGRANGRHRRALCHAPEI